MFETWKILFIWYFCYLSVRCLIPTLNVQKLDRKLIERKRQDTLEMCKIFTEQSERLQHIKTNKLESETAYAKKKRVKRELKPGVSSLNLEVAKRVENIVDKLYDDMAEHGERVTYRRRDLYTTAKVIQNQTARRFFFAPAQLLAAITDKPNLPLINDETSKNIPWIKKWKHGIIPFFIDSNTYDSHLSDIIMKAFDYFEKATCIRLQRLRERPTDKESLQNVEWLYITNPSGIRQCVHSNERKRNIGVQMIVFGYDCLSLGEIVHELMHVLGYWHEHTRPDRDQYITVLWDNIKPGYKKYFEVRSDNPLANLPYDYASVLHYPPRAFSKNGQVTLLAESGIKVGQREGLSEIDITKVTTIYGAECMNRNREYLLKTCPSVANLRNETQRVTQKEIMEYFEERLWPYGIMNYKIKDKFEFSNEERENINAVIRHIEKETCIEFRDITKDDDEENDKKNEETETKSDANQINNDQNKNVPNADVKETSTELQDQIVDLVLNNFTETTPAKYIKMTETYLKVEAPRSSDGSSDNEITQIRASSSEYNVKRRQSLSHAKVASNIKQPPLKHSPNLTYNFGTLSKVQKTKRVRRKAEIKPSPGRRHAASVLTFVRSPEPGCQCPPPGKPNGEKVLKINADCFNSVNDLLHLFVHVLGLDHQHNMYDRDSFLHVLWDNLTPDIKEEMKKKLPAAASVGFPYDYQSVMHYPWLQIKNGLTNIMYPIWNDGWAMGHWQGLSSTDVHKLNLIYFEQCTLRREQAGV